MKFSPILLSSLAFLGVTANAYAAVNMHISENAVTVNGKNVSDAENIFDGNRSVTERSYVPKDGSGAAQPDAKKLAETIEFEVYQIGENYSSHSVYKSGGGICYGYRSDSGVELTDSSTYYMKGSQQDYYVSVAGATLSSQSGPRNIQYAPVFNITDPSMEKTVRETESKQGRKMVSKNMKERNALLSEVICR